MNGFSEQNVWGDSPLAEPSSSSPQPLNPYVAEDDGEVNDFKIQNELAATMHSLRTGDDEDEDEPEDDNAGPLGGDESTHPDPLQSYGNYSYTEQDPVTPSRVSASALLSLPPEETTSPVLTPTKSGTLFDDKSAGPLGSHILEEDNTNVVDLSKSAPLPKSSVNSPNRKVSLVRPRRAKVKKTIEKMKQENTKSSTKYVDPLSQSVTKPEPPKLDAQQPTVDEILGKRSPVKRSEPEAEAAAAQMVSRVEPSEDLAKFDIIVGDPSKVGDLTNAHIVYTVTTRTDSELMRAKETEVTRRYRDFLWLYSQMLQNHPGYIIPPPPEKQVYGRFDDKFIENRRLALEKMLHKMSQKGIYQNDPDFILFLQSDDFAEESHQREHPPEVVVPTENNSFFSSLIGLNTPRYVESDPFVLEKQSHVESLDSQLRSLSKSLDFILEKREEIVKTEDEVVALVGALADVEVNATVSSLLSDFEELQKKVAQCLERTNLSQILTIGTTIDEYIRVIGSIRNCFENRFRLYNGLMILEQQQAKKQKQLAKARAQGQTDRVDRSERELARLDAQMEKQIKLREEYNATFRDELARFDGEKVTEFKHIIEIYWEGLIETQKELIELWESFYDQIKDDVQPGTSSTEAI